jgi:hypothetical protein
MGQAGAREAFKLFEAEGGVALAKKPSAIARENLCVGGRIVQTALHADQQKRS